MPSATEKKIRASLGTPNKLIEMVVKDAKIRMGVLGVLAKYFQMEDVCNGKARMHGGSFDLESCQQLDIDIEAAGSDVVKKWLMKIKEEKCAGQQQTSDNPIVPNITPVLGNEHNDIDIQSPHEKAFGDANMYGPRQFAGKTKRKSSSKK